MPSRKSSKSGRIFCAPPCKKASRTRPCSAPFAPARKPGPSAGTRFSNASPALREHHLPRILRRGVVAPDQESHRTGRGRTDVPADSQPQTARSLRQVLPHPFGRISPWFCFCKRGGHLRPLPPPKGNLPLLSVKPPDRRESDRSDLRARRG